jgi:hypothetical protein
MSTSGETEIWAVAKTARVVFEVCHSQLIDSAERPRALHEIRKELEKKNAILQANGEEVTMCALKSRH